MLYLGCPQWANNAWKGSLFTSDCQNAQMLAQYAQVFNSVEGNTTFYADPKTETVQRWHEATGDDFRFTFKFPKRFSHDLALQCDKQAVHTWLKLMSPLLEKTGSLMLQLPASFAPMHLSRLQHFMAQIPADIGRSIEVRHPEFFTKGDGEKQLNRYCFEQGIDRVCMDTRALFAAKPYNDAIIDAQQKKPHLPVHAIALGQRPIVRFVIAAMGDEYQSYYQPWLKKIKQWLDEGREPYVFLHTADNHGAPLLARQFAQDLKAHCGYHHRAIDPFAGEYKQQSSFF
ncbi:DUF72 domain-containing protein [Pseudoalteromonas sp. T1lg22]|uniref:DUF72 domain-containing protein n=1 Tax=Pseudoalteromonas sp. T1lg22 TaxID=2077096 RepID=UPI000CF6884C|nr:DUF72 domain-containing protein [Pseudoalteromonas sp. T1lg22]